MTTLEIARRMLELGEKKDALDAYTLALTGAEELPPEGAVEAAAFVLQNGGDRRAAFRTFLRLYQQGQYRDDILTVLLGAFYEPKVRRMKNRYERNRKLLGKYPYLFRRDFLPFDRLPLVFIPYDDDRYAPLNAETGELGDLFNVKEPVVTRSFFKALEQPVLADDVYSQYELEYLRDNVRRSEDIGRENHVYLHYTDWGTFCAWLQILNLKPLLEDKKVVFLIGDELAQYPIDFKERFGIDYSQYTVQPIRIAEVTRMIWHTQLSTHNGGDFFNEIFDAHPNLISLPSIMMDGAQKMIDDIKTHLATAYNLEGARQVFRGEHRNIAEELFLMKRPSDKDYLVAAYMMQDKWTKFLDPSSRIAPALFFQPHFHNIVYSLHSDKHNRTILTAKNVETLHKSKLFQGFKYIKTFTPLRRFTTSHGATVKFMYKSATEKTSEEMLGKDKKNVTLIVPDAVTQRVCNRSFLADPDDRLYKDSIIVRFEDGKLNPKATFTALADFLDLPYTESMTYCSEMGERDPESYEGNARGFDPAAIYRTYDEYVNDSERKYIEYFLRDAYEYYGYDPHYYAGEEVTEETIKAWVDGFDTIDYYIHDTWIKLYKDMDISSNDGLEVTPAIRKSIEEAMMQRQLKAFHENRVKNANIMQRDLHFVNMTGKPLRMTPMLKLDPALLENPVYH